jgi:hypothetical protein
MESPPTGNSFDKTTKRTKGDKEKRVEVGFSYFH